MSKKGVAVISLTGLGAAFLGLLGLPSPFNAIYEIVDLLYSSSAWRPCLQFNYIFRVLIIVILFILPHLLYAISSIEVFFLKEWARKTILFAAPASAVSAILACFFVVINTPALRAVSIKCFFAYSACLYVVISAVIIISFLTRPAIKELFKCI